jgi:Tol biopolymer transport system component/DNA-binding winged helix-turn-helix (wHTH) protein
VVDGDRTLQIEPKVMQVLLLLARHAGEPLTRERIMASVWSDVVVTDDTLTRCISEARKVFDSPQTGHRARRDSIIDTIPKVGYRLAARVEPVSRVRSNHAPLTLSISPSESTRSNPGWLTFSKPALWPGILVLIALAVWQIQREGDSDFAHSDLVISSPRPLTSLDGREGQAAFSPVDQRVAFVHTSPDTDVVELQTITPGDARGFVVYSSPGSISAPRWSSDGRTLFFVGMDTTASGDATSCMIRKAPALGGPTTDVVPCTGRFVQFDVSPDDRWIIMDGQEAPGEPSRISMIDLESGSVDWIDNDDPQTHDYAPRFSRDGREVLFSRTLGEGQADLFLLTRSTGQTRRLSNELENIAGHAWIADGKQSVFSAGLIGDFRLKTLDHETGNLTALGLYGLRPSVDRTGSLIAFETLSIDADLALVRGQSTSTACASTRYDRNPALSADGQDIVFVSDRRGIPGLFRCDLSNNTLEEIPVSGFDTILGPAIGPDGRIAFGALRNGEVNVYIIDRSGSEPRLLTAPGSNDMHPSFSSDGRWVYFSSDRSGRMEVWRTPVGETSPEQLTVNGAIQGQVSQDGTWLYFQKTPETELWRMPVAGDQGQPQLVDSDITMSDLYHWQPHDQGILLARAAPGNTVTLEYIDSESSARALLQTLSTGRLAFGFAASEDLSVLVGAVVDRVDSDLMLVDLPTGH